MKIWVESIRNQSTPINITMRNKIRHGRHSHKIAQSCKSHKASQFYVMDWCDDTRPSIVLIAKNQSAAKILWRRRTQLTVLVNSVSDARRCCTTSQRGTQNHTHTHVVDGAITNSLITSQRQAVRQVSFCNPFWEKQAFYNVVKFLKWILVYFDRPVSCYCRFLNLCLIRHHENTTVREDVQVITKLLTGCKVLRSIVATTESNSVVSHAGTGVWTLFLHGRQRWPCLGGNVRRLYGVYSSTPTLPL